MQNIFKWFGNIFFNKSNELKQISATEDFSLYECLECGSELKVHNGYGTLRVICKCGYATDVYTGKNIHFKNDTKNTTAGHILTKEERESIIEQRRRNVFDKYLNSDLKCLYDIISNKRDITKQIRHKECIDLLNEVDDKEGYEKILIYLQKFCGLESVPLNVVWEPMDNPNTLSSTEKETNVMGTTYFLPLKSLLFYTIYLNPKFISSKERLIATIAHELSHIYANHNHIQFTLTDNERGNKAYSEQMTDLLGIVLGMGELMCTSSDRNESFDTGYLTSDMICKSHNLWISEYLTGKNKDIKTLVICEQCFQKLKVPISKKKLHLVCPKCKKAFTYRSF